MERRTNKGKVILISFAALAALLYLAKKMNWLKPLEGVITSGYGMRLHPVTKVEHFHNGIDIAAKEGTEIKAPADARVIKVLSNDIGGKQMILQHAEGFKTGYAHLSQTLRKEGDQVKAGDIIALVGKTGRVTGAHLHFTLRNGAGEFLNPETFIYKRQIV